MIPSSGKKFAEFLDQFRSGTLPDAEEQAGSAARPEERKPRWPYLKFYLQWLRPFRAAILLVLVLAFIGAGLALVTPYGFKIIVDDVLQNESFGTTAEKTSRLHLVGGIILLILLLHQAVETVRNHRMNVLNLKVLRGLQQNLYEHLLKLPLHKLQEMKTGGIVTRVSSDVNDVSGLLQMGLITPVVAVFRVIATMGVLVWIEWRMAVVSLGLLLPIVAINFFWIRKLKPLHRSIRKDRGEANARVVETFGGLPVVRIFRRERKEARDFAVGQNTIIRKRLLTRIYYLAISGAWGLLIPLTGLIIVWYGGTRYLVDQVSIGEIIAFQGYVFFLMMPISQIVQSWSETQQALAALERIFDIIQHPVDLPDKADAANAPARVETIRFENVTFGYDPDRPVLHDISLDVSAGQTVALVGKSGAGKTTLTNLVARFYDPDAGRILLDGVDLRNIKRESYRSLLGMVQQDVFLFDGTVRENIEYGRRGATMEQIIEAARRANAHDFIDELPERYDSLIGERGIKLSGGQKQRVSIARALLADPQILILDEATSNLDTESEQLIQASLLELLSNRTTFVIAHRLSTVQRADLILVMEEGRIAETGTHAELMARRSSYREMVERQIRFESTVMDATGDGEWS